MVTVSTIHKGHRVNEDHFTAADDRLHEPSGNFYETETYWFSFFVPQRRIGGWLYASVRANAGVTGGGLWMWDDRASTPWEVPFYENFQHLKLPRQTGPNRLDFPTGMSVQVREPGTSYDLAYDDRDRITVALRFDALEPPVPLRPGAPPYPKASHYDQTGHVTGQVVLDGERIDVDCYAMRDRSWGPRYERGYRRVGYSWAASAELSLLTYTSPGGGTPELVHSGYIRRGADVAQISGGRRTVQRDPEHGWLTGIALEITDEHGRTITATAEGLSRMVLPSASAICINTSLRWTINDGAATTAVDGEDQDVWPVKEWRRRRPASS
jgi:hypothetical protein